MMIDTKEFKKAYSHPNIEILEKKIIDGGKKFFLKGLAGSSTSLFSSNFADIIRQAQLFILKDKESAAYFYNDLTHLQNSSSVYFFPSSYKRSLLYHQPDPENIVLRTEILNILANSKRKIIIVTHPEALIEKVLHRNELRKNTLQLSTGEKISLTFIEEVFEEYMFERVDFVYEPGQYSIRGSIVDVFSFSNKYPFRIDFFGDEVESIRSFDAESQLSIQPVSKISILPDITKLSGSLSLSFLDILDPSVQIWIEDLSLSLHTISKLFEASNSIPGLDETEEQTIEEKMRLFINHDTFLDGLNKFTTFEFGGQNFFEHSETILFQTSPQPSFNKNFELLATTLLENKTSGYTNYIISENVKQVERLLAIFSDIKKEVEFIPVSTNLHEGFVDHQMKICCYTDHQIFERYHKYQLKKNFSRKHAITIKELTGLLPGDYVVHIDHGIGRFGGLEKIEINGKVQESVKLVYKDNDTLYVSIHSLHRISKYKGKDLEPPRIYKLGSGSWQKLKEKSKKRVQDIARELITLYAKRKATSGFGFSPDSYMQQELEASFLFEDTPDQLETTRAVKEGMELSFPMDRLVCGDVGFGKTEIAVRAAFKAVTDSKQVALLVPTTILALQHYNTFKSRLHNFPCRVEYISRFKSPGQQKSIISDIANGKIDIIIGTHRLVSKDVHFKDLGLFIVDEEQKFGVAVKEKIRNLKINVDTLTLTATPIPRTLQFSMMGARDLSVMRTPPPNRHPIITELHGFNEEIIKEGIEYEISRGGQVFFIHNRVDSILEIQKLIHRLIPKVTSAVAHGKMEGNKLETIMMDFIHGGFDVLIATTIIESGLDIPNSNTIFINNAQNFGLSDLHQLRGRVGRSNKKAFCFLLAPPLQTLSSEARRRLKAIEEFSELGSGFNIAMQDLDIRGAGNLLGAQQSGFISEIGLETFQRILEEAVIELRETEFKEELAENREKSSVSEPQIFVKEVHIETDLELLLPESYIENIGERIRLYKSLDDINGQQELDSFRKNLEDRFGPIPQSTNELMNIVPIRKLAKKLGFEKIILKKKSLILHFISNPESAYYNSPLFGKVIAEIQKNKKNYKIKERNLKLMLSVNEVHSTSMAIQILESLVPDNN